MTVSSIEPTAVTPHTARVPPRIATPRAVQPGFTLLEAALVASITGMVLAVAVPTFVRSLETSKAAEASQRLAQLYRSSAAYYAIPRPTTDAKSAYCLPPSAGPAPATPSPTPARIDFSAQETPGAQTWRALDFAPREPLRYRYTFLPPGFACLLDALPQPPMLTLRAEGDLDGDGTLSRFERRAHLGGHGVLEAERLLHVSDRTE